MRAQNTGLSWRPEVDGLQLRPIRAWSLSASFAPNWRTKHEVQLKMNKSTQIARWLSAVIMIAYGFAKLKPNASTWPGNSARG